MRKGILLLLIPLLAGCARLDPFMFNPDNTISEYKLDAFDEPEIGAPAQYDIDPSLIDVFSMKDADGNEIWAIYIGDQSRIATDTVIMYCHGNSGHMDYYWPRQKLLANIGGKNRFGVLMIDYKGFGLSTGTPTEGGLTDDVNLALDWLKERGLTNDRLAMYGFSLGTAPATDIAANGGSLTPAWLLLENPFASTQVMVNDAAVLNIPNSWLTNGDYDNAEEIKKVNQPFFWIHGVDDVFLNLETHGEVVYKNYNGSRGVAVRVPGGEHGNTPQKMGYEEYLLALENFFF